MASSRHIVIILKQLNQAWSLDSGKPADGARIVDIVDVSAETYGRGYLVVGAKTQSIQSHAPDHGHRFYLAFRQLFPCPLLPCPPGPLSTLHSPLLPIPDNRKFADLKDVTIQVLTQSRAELIRRTFDAIAGSRRAIVHLYNSTSELQRRVVFGQDRAGIIDIAVRGAKLIGDLAASVPDTEIIHQYSPESFTVTELDFAVEICETVLETCEATPAKKAILNLPATVEMATPNIYADQIEWFGRRITGRNRFVLSVHPHNDRGTGVAAAELAILAGAERVEGTLFGNGERTGKAALLCCCYGNQ